VIEVKVDNSQQPNSRWYSGSGIYRNVKPVKIRGVCNHHDLGSLGAAVNARAIERQLEMLKAMGVNGIRTSHNPPALTDRMASRDG
jgi:beta-galactosidase